MGARQVAQALVEGTLVLRCQGRSIDLSGVSVEGVFVHDMIAHNNDKNRDVFQISPGSGRESMWLAYQAHRANLLWNACAPVWNTHEDRKGCGPGQRSSDGMTIPKIARHPVLSGEVRAPLDPRSSLYNTDGQVFSDAGVPVVLFMENYDINRVGYHDSHDTLANIDLDYGAALAAIAIETAARTATRTLDASDPFAP
jgi:hypothetical protein